MARGDYLRDVLASGECPRCERRTDDLDERYSYGVYAGVMCPDCARSGYRDACGLGPGGRQGNPADLDEDYDPELGAGKEPPEAW